MNSIGKNIGILCRQLNIYLNHSLEQTDITPTELMFLGDLSASDGKTQEDIARDFSIDKSAVARTIQALEKKDLITRRSDDNDRRNKRVFLTDKASQYSELLTEIQNDWSGKAFDNISDEEINIFSKVLDRVIDNIR